MHYLLPQSPVKRADKNVLLPVWPDWAIFESSLQQMLF